MSIYVHNVMYIYIYIYIYPERSAAGAAACKLGARHLASRYLVRGTWHRACGTRYHDVPLFATFRTEIIPA